MLSAEPCDPVALHPILRPQGLIGPITHLRFLDAPDTISGKLLLALVGSRLRLYRVGLQDQDSTAILEVSLGQGFRGHGMAIDRPLPPINPTSVERIHILVWGGKRMCQLDLQVSWSPTGPTLSHLPIIHPLPESKDWIMDALLLRVSPHDSLPSFLASIDAHNQLTLRSYPDLSFFARYQCSERCLLYCARLRGGRTLKDGLLIASGTVFQGVLLWSIPLLQETPQPELVEVEVEQRFTDHEGVIFSVRFSRSGDRVISVSDDRSIRIWPRILAGSSMRHPLVFYGHQARVWDAILLDQEDLVVSVGEDATCRVWDLTDDPSGGQLGRAIACWEGHAVKHIWSLDINEPDGLVATGGGDHGVKLWSLQGVFQSRQGQDEVESQALHTWPFPQVEEYLEGEDTVPPKGLWENEAFRNFVLLDSTSLAMVTSAGCVVHCSKEEGIPSHLLHYSPHLAGYASMTSSTEGGFIVCGGLEGHLILIFPGSPDQTVTIHPHRAKVSDIFVQADDGTDSKGTWLVFSVGLDSTLLQHRVSIVEGVWKVDTEVHYSLPPHTLPMTVAYASGKAMVLGSREGAILAYDLSSFPSSSSSNTADGVRRTIAPGWEQRRAHGKDSVTSVLLTRDPEDEGQVTLWSAGRDGAYCRWRLFPSDSSIPWGFDRVHRSRVTKGWIERVMFVDDELLLLGFYRKRFFILNETRRLEVLSLACGGGHRRWHLLPGPDSQLGSAVFAYFRKGEIRSYSRKDQTSTLPFAHPTCQEGFHGREIRQTLYLDPRYTDGLRILVTAGEDGIIRVAHCPVDKPDQVRTLCKVKKHTSVIRGLSTSQGCSTLLFSCGGNEELRAWRLQVRSLTGGRIDCQCLEWAQCPIIGDVPEVRIMDLTSWCPTTTLAPEQQVHFIFAGYSDATWRLWAFSEFTRTFTLLSHATAPRCVLAVKEVQLPQSHQQWILLGCTDGSLSILDVTGICQDYLDHHRPFDHDKDGKKDTSILVWKGRVHASGVNQVTSWVHPHGPHGDGEVLKVATGGDDNSITFLEFLYPFSKKHVLERGMVKDKCIVLHRQTSQQSAHASSIQGLEITPDGKYLLSTSLDQRVYLWSIPFGSSGKDDLALVHGVMTDVPDPSTLSLGMTESDQETGDGEGYQVVVGGIGIETFSLCSEKA